MFTACNNSSSNRSCSSRGNCSHNCTNSRFTGCVLDYFVFTAQNIWRQTLKITSQLTSSPVNNLFLFSMLGLTGCATGYHSTGFTGGFHETQLAPDIFRVAFHGNGYTSMDRAQDFTLLRAAELTLANGYHCFAIINESHLERPFTVTTPATASTYSSGMASGNGTISGNQWSDYSYYHGQSTTVVDPGQTFTFFKPSSGLLIRCFSNPPPHVFTFNASFLHEKIRAEYHLKN